MMDRGYCGPLESRSLCDAFDVTSTFGFEWEAEADDKTSAAEMSTESVEMDRKI